MIDFAWFGLAGFVTSVIFAAFLQWKRAVWESEWIWTVLIIVFVGVSYTGAFMYLFTRYGVIPDDFTSYREAIQWANWRWVYLFLWTGTPMCIWRVAVFASQLRAVGRTAMHTLFQFGDALRDDREDDD